MRVCHLKHHERVSYVFILVDFNKESKKLSVIDTADGVVEAFDIDTILSYIDEGINIVGVSYDTYSGGALRVLLSPKDREDLKTTKCIYRFVYDTVTKEVQYITNISEPEKTGVAQEIEDTFQRVSNYANEAVEKSEKVDITSERENEVAEDKVLVGVAAGGVKSMPSTAKQGVSFCKSEEDSVADFITPDEAASERDKTQEDDKKMALDSTVFNVISEAVKAKSALPTIEVKQEIIENALTAPSASITEKPEEVTTLEDAFVAEIVEEPKDSDAKGTNDTAVKKRKDRKSRKKRNTKNGDTGNKVSEAAKAAEEAIKNESLTILDYFDRVSKELIIEIDNPEVVLNAKDKSVFFKITKTCNDFVYFCGDDISISLAGEIYSDIALKDKILKILSQIPFVNKQGTNLNLYNVCCGSDTSVAIYKPFSKELGASDNSLRISIYGVR